MLLRLYYMRFKPYISFRVFTTFDRLEVGHHEGLKVIDLVDSLCSESFPPLYRVHHLSANRRLFATLPLSQFFAINLTKYNNNAATFAIQSIQHYSPSVCPK